MKGYAAHERGVFEEVTKARAAMAQASTPGEAGAADSLLGQALGRLFAVAEAYPDLKASQNFLQLQSELTDTEDKIAAARRYYNATVLAYNTATQTFPSLLLAGTAGFPAREFFAADEDDRAPVAVSLAVVAHPGVTLQQQIRSNRIGQRPRRHRVRRPDRRLRRGLGSLPGRARRRSACSHSGSPTGSSRGGTRAG